MIVETTVVMASAMTTLIEVRCAAVTLLEMHLATAAETETETVEEEEEDTETETGAAGIGEEDSETGTDTVEEEGGPPMKEVMLAMGWNKSKY